MLACCNTANYMDLVELGTNPVTSVAVPLALSARDTVSGFAVDITFRPWKGNHGHDPPSRSEQDQIVAVDQFRAVDVAEEGLDVLCAVAGDAASFGA